MAECSHASAAPISAILIENGVDFNAIDSGLNNGISDFIIKNNTFKESKV